MSLYLMSAMCAGVAVGMEVFINKSLNNTLIFGPPIGRDKDKLDQAQAHHSHLLEQLVPDDVEHWMQRTQERSAIKHIKYPKEDTSPPMGLLPYWRSNGGYDVKWFDLDR